MKAVASAKTEKVGRIKSFERFCESRLHSFWDEVISIVDSILKSVKLKVSSNVWNMEKREKFLQRLYSLQPSKIWKPIA